MSEEKQGVQAPLILTVRWDKQGMPAVNVLSGDESARDVIAALSLAQRVISRRLERQLVKAHSEVAHLRALLEVEREGAEAAPPAEALEVGDG
jgi:hypothetical protein